MMGMHIILFSSFNFSLVLSLPSHTWKAACRLRTSLCLQFKPHHIAAGAIFLAAKFLKVKLPSDGEKVWWQQFDVTPRQLEGWCPATLFCNRELMYVGTVFKQLHGTNATLLVRL